MFCPFKNTLEERKEKGGLHFKQYNGTFEHSLHLDGAGVKMLWTGVHLIECTHFDIPVLYKLQIVLYFRVSNGWHYYVSGRPFKVQLRFDDIKTPTPQVYDCYTLRGSELC